VTVADLLRARQRDYQLTAVARSDAGDQESAKVAALVALVLREIADAVDQEDEED
jgi:hypothetical protein